MLLFLPLSIGASLALSVAREMFRRQGELGMARVIGLVHTLILVLLPVAAVVGLQLVAPGYLHSLGADGRMALSGAGCAQIAIHLTIRKAIDVSVQRFGVGS